MTTTDIEKLVDRLWDAAYRDGLEATGHRVYSNGAYWDVVRELGSLQRKLARARQKAKRDGRKGGRARAANLSPRRRSQLARRAAQARWGKK